LLRIVDADLSSIPLIRDLTFRIWPQTYRGILSDAQIEYMLDMMYSESSLEKQIISGAQFIFVYDADVPVGFASYQEIEPAVYKLHKIYILPGQQGKGTGKFVIGNIIDRIKNKGAKSLQLQVNKNNKAKSFYERLGFSEVDRIKLDIGNGYFMDDFIMQKTLEG
jgi:ribosomal protein S18 acetylase RimI-like enzyme